MSVETEIAQARHWLEYFAKGVSEETPMKLHENTGGGLGFAPPFHSEFVRYIGELECKVPGCAVCLKRKRQHENYGRPRQRNMNNRTTKAFRRLRKIAPVEFDVLWMAVNYGLTIEQITDRMNDWATRKGHPDTYTPEGITVLALSGLDKLERIW